MNLLNSHTTSVVAFVLVLCLSISFLWCSDSTCQDGQEDECTCLMCSFFKESNSDSPDSASHLTRSCSCVCQILFIPGFHSISFCHLNPEMLTVSFSLPVLAQSLQRLHKPPRLQALSANSFNVLFNHYRPKGDEQCLEYFSFHQPC